MNTPEVQLMEKYAHLSIFGKQKARHIEAYGVSPSKNRWVGNVPKFASLNEACKAAVTAEIENVDSTTKYSTVPENKIFWMCTLN